MRKKSFSQAKIGVFFIVAVMAFAAIGASVAHWEETLTISGVMTTDDIDPYFANVYSNDYGADNNMDPDECGYWYNTPVWQGERRDKNVGYCGVTSDDYILNIDIGDAYPCYYAHPAFEIKNRGSAPVLVHNIQLLEISFEDTVYTLDSPMDIMPGQIWGVRIFLDSNGDPVDYDIHSGVDNALDDFRIMLTGDDLIINKQLDPESWVNNPGLHMENPDEYTDTIFGDLCIHFENGCEQSVDYDFKIGIVFYNWPEYVDVTPQQVLNTIASSTMIFKGDLTDEGDDSYTGTVAMIDEEAEGLGDGESGFDIYAENGAMATYDKAGSGSQDYECGPVAIHDAYNTAGGWGSFYDPDCADYYHYQLRLTDTDEWYLEYVSGGTAHAYPMSGEVDWINMYATETGAGEYYTDPTTKAESYGYALNNVCTGVNDGTQSWDMDWSWGSEYIPLQYPGYDVTITGFDGSGEYTVKLTPAP